MGLFDKLKEMKADHDAKKAAEAAERLALCNRLRQNEIFLNYADRLYENLRDDSNANIQWATGRSADEDNRRLAIVLTANDFGLVRYWSYEQPYRDSEGKVRTWYCREFEPIDVQKFADYGMQQLPSGSDVVNAVLETLASRLKDIDFVTLNRDSVTRSNFDGQIDHPVRFDAILINVSHSRVQSKRSTW